MRSYDALNLLDAVPPRAVAVDPPSPTLSAGFSDLPSDSEEMFYFDADTREEIGREKKRRKMDEGREERLRALRVQEEAERVADEVRCNHFDRFDAFLGVRRASGENVELAGVVQMGPRRVGGSHRPVPSRLSLLESSD